MGMDAPTLDEALEGQQRLIAEKLQSTIENENLAYYKRIAEEMLEENDSVTVVAKMMTKEPDTTRSHQNHLLFQEAAVLKTRR